MVTLKVTSFPHFKQVDFTDCGPACLQMVARYYGKDYSLSMLSSLCGVNAEGTTLLGMSEAAEHIGFNTFSVKTTIEKMREEDVLPCVALWRQNHYVVIYKIEKDKIFVADPASKLVEYSDEEFMKKWAIPGDEAMRGIVLILEPRI